MRDKLFQKLKIGDLVIYNPPNKKGLVISKIVRFTLRGITTDRGDNRQFSDVLKINEQYQNAINENPEEFI